MTDDLLTRLQYIADSPAPEHGGFHTNLVQMAKDAIEEIKLLRDQIKIYQDVLQCIREAFRD